jgi:hypothetical protein
MTARIIEGGCLCGAVRYRVDAEPEGATLCHCKTCRRAAAAPSVAWVIFPADRFAFVRGEPAFFRSSPHVERGFCGRCGTPLVYRSERRPRVVDVTMVSLDEPDAFAPDREIWTGEKLAWDIVNPKLPQYPRSSKG